MKFELLLPAGESDRSVDRPYTAAFLPVEQFPVDPRVRRELAENLIAWLEEMQAGTPLKSLTWLEMNKLPPDQGGPKVSANGRLWLPETGLGVFPHRPPPRLWSANDFLDRDYGSPMPALINTVFLVRNSEPAARHAFRTMVGGGTVTHVLTEDPGAFLEHAENELLPSIREEALRGHPFYVPLLTAAAVQAADAAQLRAWLGPAKVYLRDSTEDRGILILASRHKASDPLRLLLAASATGQV